MRLGRKIREGIESLFEDKDKAEAKQTKRMRSGPYSGKEGRAGFEGKKTGFINDAKGKPKAGGGKAQ